MVVEGLSRTSTGPVYGTPWLAVQNEPGDAAAVAGLGERPRGRIAAVDATRNDLISLAVTWNR
jgi:hypothetical protein